GRAERDLPTFRGGGQRRCTAHPRARRGDQAHRDANPRVHGGGHRAGAYEGFGPRPHSRRKPRNSPIASNPSVLYISFGVSKRSEINKVHSHRASIARLQASKSIVRPTPRIRKTGWVAPLSIQAKMPAGQTLTVPAAVA